MSSWKDKCKVMQRYDLTAEMYEERYSGEQKAKYLAALEIVNVSSHIVLDVGCGTALFFSQVDSQADIIVGVDISHKLLLKANQQAKASGNAFILQADADHLPFRDNLFDDVFAFTVLQNMPNPTETLAELKRSAKVGGKVVVTGLKKAFPLPKFMDVLEGSGLCSASFIDRQNLNCYVAILTV